MQIDNYGTVSVSRTATSTNALAAIDSDDDTDTLVVNNHTGATLSASGPNAFTVGGRAGDYTIQNDGTITATGTFANNTTTGAVPISGPVAIWTYTGGDDEDSNTTIDNSAKGVINGNLVISDANPLTLGNVTANARSSSITNEGQIDGSFYYYGLGEHVLDNSGTITGSIFVDQTHYTSSGGESPTFTLTNEGTIGGDISLTEVAGSVNAITLTGTGFTGNVSAVGNGSNSLTLAGVTSLASVQNFTDLNLTTSNVAIAGGVSLVPDQNAATPQSTLETTVFGQGGTNAAPSTNIGSINGALNLGGATVITPSFAGIARNGDVYQVALAVSGDLADITVQNTSALVNMRADTSTGALLLDASVMNPAAVPGISKAGGATLANLLGYSGSNPALQALGGAVESLTSLNDVRNAGEQLRPDVSGATIQVPIDISYAFQSQIGSRLDSLFYGALAAQQGRSADYSPPRAPVIIEPYNGVWVNGLGANTQQHTVDAVAGYRADTGGFIAGYDRLFQNTVRLGAAFGYATSEINNSDLLGNRESLQTYQGLVYGQLVLPQGYVNGSFGVGNLEYNTKRTINFPGFADVATASYGGMIYSGRVDVGYPLVTGLGIFVPVAAVTYAHVDQDAYTELSAAGSGLTIAKQSTDSVRSALGLKAIFPFYASATFGAALETRAVWLHEYENTAQSISAGFVGGDGSFLTTGPTPTRDMADLGAALRLSLPRIGDSLSVSYNAIVRQSYVEQVGMLRARVDF